MSKTSLIIGPSGSGKTVSIKNLNPESTFIFNCLGKDLPWKNSTKNYQEIDKETKEGNMLTTNKHDTIIAWLKHISKNREEIHDIVIDDNTFVTSLELLRRGKETNWDKFIDIAQNFIELATVARSLREDINVYIMHHTTTDGDGILESKTFRAQSYGKLIDEKLGSIEAQFTIVLRAAKILDDTKEYQHVFYTKDKLSTVKTPPEMFSNETIPNDLALVSKAIRCYYDGNC